MYAAPICRCEQYPSTYLPCTRCMHASSSFTVAHHSPMSVQFCTFPVFFTLFNYFLISQTSYYIYSPHHRPNRTHIPQHRAQKHCPWMLCTHAWYAIVLCAFSSFHLQCIRPSFFSATLLRLSLFCASPASQCTIHSTHTATPVNLLVCIYIYISYSFSLSFLLFLFIYFF